MKNIKIVFTILLINFCLTLKAQIPDRLTEKTLENKKFKTNQIIGIKNFNYNSVITSIEFFEPKDKYFYGDITTFKNGKFTSGNFGPCGNECRITVTGNYSFKGNKVYLFLETISFWKDCSNKPMQTINKEIGNFVWNKNKDGTIILTNEK